MNFLTGSQADALRTLRETWAENEIVIVGAAALRYHLGLDWRETHDLDLSIATSVEDHAAVLGQLPGWSRDSRMERRWLAPGDTRIDIIPASDELVASGELIWPESGFRMSLAGFGLAFELGDAIEIAPGVSVLVTPLGVMIVLKMSAYLDRPAERERDLADLAVVLERGVRPDDQARFDDDVFAAGLSYEEAGPFALGRRVSDVVGADERRVVDEFLGRAMDPEAPGLVLERLARQGPAIWRRDVAAAELRIRAFRAGFDGGRDG